MHKTQSSKIIEKDNLLPQTTLVQSFVSKRWNAKATKQKDFKMSHQINAQNDASKKFRPRIRGFRQDGSLENMRAFSLQWSKNSPSVFGSI